jgi:hypothetical protein
MIQKSEIDRVLNKSECNTSIDKMRLLWNGQRMIYACHSRCGGLMVYKWDAVLILREPITLACSVDCVNWKQPHCKYTVVIPWEMCCSVIFYQVFIFFRTAEAGIEVEYWGTKMSLPNTLKAVFRWVLFFFFMRFRIVYILYLLLGRRE